MNFLKKLFHTHVYDIHARKVVCDHPDCEFEPSCPKHGKTMYLHGYDEIEMDCFECEKERRTRANYFKKKV